MQASNFNIKSEKTVQFVAMILGIMCGYFSGAQFNHNSEKLVDSAAKQLWVTNSTRIVLSSKNQTINETALFLVADDTTLADELAQHIKVLCWMQAKHIDRNRFDAIKRTWGRRCTAFIAIDYGTGANSTDIFHISTTNERQQSNVENAYRFIADTYANEFDWLLNTNGNSFIVMENLRYHLYAYDPFEPIAVGHLLNKTNEKHEYLSMKSGYALSRRAVENLVTGFSNASTSCAVTREFDDEIHFSGCLREVGIQFSKSTDQHGKRLFFDQYLDRFFLPISLVELPHPWYQDYKVSHYLNEASNYSIAFYGLSWKQMYVMEFLIYQLRPYGVETITPPLPERIRFDVRADSISEFSNNLI